MSLYMNVFDIYVLFTRAINLQSIIGERNLVEYYCYSFTINIGEKKIV